MNNNNNKTYKGISSKKTVILGAHVVSPSAMELLPMEDMPLLDKRDQAIVIEEGVIKDIVPSSEAPFGEEWEVYDVRGAVVIPALTECHTHAIFAGDRAAEFHARIQGETYHDQQKKGGINATVSATRDATDEALLNNLEHWLEVFLGQGATAVEVKSGYGLSHDQEIRLLRIINRAKADKQHGVEVEVIPTYLGAHAVPRDAKSREDYIEEMIIKTLPMVKHENLAEFVDVFVASVAYSVEEADIIYSAAHKLGFKLKAHLWELEHDNSRELLEKYPFVSVDHLEFAQKEDLEVAFARGTVPVLLPLTAWHLGYNIRRTYDVIKELKGYFAISTDFNPGTSFSPSLWQAFTVAHIEFGLPIEELFFASTVYAAKALGLNDMGAIVPGNKADLVVLNVPSLDWLGYLHGINPVDMVFKNGSPVQ
ncbi:MAG TPA: imidazolonepropionase [Coprothermobacter proteolyticus]|nr:imidazolonepropionase [Coprothermobacter proteolyticus]HPO83133.1 imidazolonepropionase [Coprothermobacter proteolyticus]